MSIKKFVVIIFVFLTFVFSQQSFASLSTRVIICAVKGTVQTGPAVSGGHQGSLYTCPLKQTLDQTECRVVNVATMIETGHDGFAIVKYRDGTKIKIGPDTKLVLRRNNIYIEGGKAWFKVEKQKDGKLLIKTPTAIAGIRGTEFLMNVEENGATNLQLIKGNIEVSDINQQSTINLSAGMEVTVPVGSSVLNAKLLKINENDKWWTNWPTLVPIAEKPGYGGMTGITNGGQQIPASADAYVYAYAYRNWNRSNRGKYEQLVAGWHPTGGESRAYIRFDLNGINPASVHRAVLRLYHTGTYGNDGVKLGIYRVSDPWVEGRDTYHPGQAERTAGPGVLSWVQQPVFNNSVIATFNPGMANKNWVEVDITPLVKQWLAGFQNNGLLIKPAGNMYSAVSESAYHFASREVADKNHRPVLILNGPPASGSTTSTHINSSGTTNANSVKTVQNVWAVNQAGLIYHLNSQYFWIPVAGRATDIGVGANGTVWIIGKQNVSGSYDIERWMGTQFVKVPGGAVRVDVGPWGTPWVVNASGDIFYRKNKVWNQIPGKAKDIGVGANGTVWVLGNKAVFGGFEIFRWTGSTFVKIPGAAVRIDVDPNGNPWVVNAFGVIYRWKNNTWQALPGRASDISVGSNGAVWIIGTSKIAGGHDIYRWNEKRQNWDRIPGGATAISVGGMQTGNLSTPVPDKFGNAVAKPCGSNADFVRSLYQSILGRDMLLPLKAGHGLGHVQALQNGVSRKQIITNFFHSPEYQNKHKLWPEFIKDAYQACLGRNPSTAEVKAWHQNNYDQALQVFFKSKEYSNLMASCHKKTPNKGMPKLFNHDIVGQWKWGSGSLVSIYPNGKVKSSDGNSGTWTIGSSTDTFVIHWIKGHNIDWLLLKADKLKGKNQKGAKVSAKKIVVDFKSGKYRVEQYIGSTYKSEWKVQVKKDKITGKSEWTCCPGRRIDPIRGYVNGYTVVIERDCSGQNWSGACRQKFVGTLMGSKIEGTCTGTGIVGIGHWVLYLK